MTSQVAATIKQELARRRLSRAALAAEAKISLSALEKGLSGQRKFSENALVRIGDVLGLSLQAQAATLAPDELGGYARASVSFLEGNYLTLRPSSKRREDVFAYIIDVVWDAARSHLVFKELARADKDYAQFGDVALPHQTGHIYFSTNRHGQQRLMVMRRQARSAELFGLLLTLQQEKGERLLPVAMPVVMLPLATLKEAPSLGVISQGHKAHGFYAGKLAEVLGDGYAIVLGNIG